MSDPKESARIKFIETAHIIKDGANNIVGGVYIPLTYNGGTPNFNDQERALLGQMLAKAQGVQQVPGYRLPNGTETTGVFVPEDQNPGFRDRTIQAQDKLHRDRRAAHEAEMAKLKEQDPKIHTDRASQNVRAQLDLMGVPKFDVVPGTGGANIPLKGMTADGLTKLETHLKKQGILFDEARSSTSGHVLKLHGVEVNDPRVVSLLENHARANPPDYSAGHKNGHGGPGGQRGHAHVGAMGLAATVLMGAMAFQQAKAAGLDLKGQFKAVATAVLPTGAAIAQGRRAEAIASLIDKEPTGYLSNAVRGVMRDIGLNVEEGALSSALKNKNPQQVIRDKQLNDRIGREQAALFNQNHPDQLGALKLTDPKTGKKLDTANVLKDPAQRHVVFDEIKRLEKSASTPETREAVGHMREAAQQFVDLEKRRRPVLDSADYAMGTGPGVTKQVVASPVIGSPAGGPG